MSGSIHVRNYLLSLPAPLRGALWAVLAATMFAAMGGGIRQLAETGVHPLVTGFFRSAIGIVLMLPFFLRGGFDLLRTRRHGVFLMRGAASAVGQAFYFVAIAFLPMADAISLTFTAPLFGTVLAVLVLGEVLRMRRWAATLIGFAGALIVLRPGFAEITWLTATPLFAALSMAVIWVLVKMLSRTEPTDRIVVYMMVYTLPVSLVMALFVWTTPEPRHIPWLVGTAVVANLGQFAMTNAYRAADATAVFPFDFLRLPLTALIAYFVFAQPPDAWTWIGAVVIFGSTIYIGRREAVMGRQPATAGTAAADSFRAGK